LTAINGHDGAADTMSAPHINTVRSAPMVRHTKSTSTQTETASSDAEDVGFNLLYGNTTAVREMFNSSLVAAQNLAQWLGQSQQLNVQAVDTWNENLGNAMREAEQANDIQKLLVVGTNLLNRQMGTSMQQFGAGIKQTLETEAQFIERMRNTATAMSQRMMQGAMSGQATLAQDGSAASPMSQLSNAQAQWLSLTQRWMESVKPATHN
jgi:predicted NBD/HSP70 family sugar kinase